MKKHKKALIAALGLAVALVFFAAYEDPQVDNLYSFEFSPYNGTTSGSDTAINAGMSTVEAYFQTIGMPLPGTHTYADDSQATAAFQTAKEAPFQRMR